MHKTANGTIPLSRRTLLKYGAAASAFTFAPGFVNASFGQDRSKTLVIAAPATPLSLDVENSLSPGTIDTVAAFYDYLIGFGTIPDTVDGVMREDLEPRPDLPGGYNLKGMLAESWAFAEDGKSVVFTLRQGVLSNWGNELTAEDVKYTFDRKFEVKGAGAFMTSVMGLPDKDAVKVESKYVVSFTLKDPNPILMIVCGHLANPIFDSTKCKEMATTDDPWARNFLDTNVAGFGPYALKDITRGQQMVATARSDYYGEKPYFETVVFREVPISATRLQLLQGGAVDIAQNLGEQHGCNCDVDRSQSDALDRTQHRIRAARQHQGAPGAELRHAQGRSGQNDHAGLRQEDDNLHAGFLSRCHCRIL